MHSTSYSSKWFCAPPLRISESEVSITVLCLRCSPRYTQQYKSKTVRKVLLKSKVTLSKIRWCRLPQLLSETKDSISLPCQLCSRYTVLRIYNSLISTSVIKVATMKNTGDLLRTISGMQGKPPYATTKLMLFTEHKGGFQ